MTKRALLAVIGLAAAWGQAGGCSASGAAPTNGGSGGSFDGGLPMVQIDAPMADQNAGGSIQDLNALCGMAACLPDSPASAPGDGGVPPPPGAGGSVGEGGHSGAGAPGTPGASGEGGESSGAAGANPGMGGMAGEGGATGGEGGVGGDANGGASNAGAAGTPDPPIPVEGCRITREENRVVSDYRPAGDHEVNGPCFSSADCKPGLGCVNQEGIGRCLPFCCKGNDSCLEEGTYCAPRRLLEMPINAGPENPADGLLVPVCVTAVPCTLDQPYPCPDGMACACGEKACMVVRSGGIISCEDPQVALGEGQAGQSCPCAWGHVCSQTTDTCAELCTTASEAKACTQGKCQDTAELPPGWGVCVANAASR